MSSRCFCFTMNNYDEVGVAHVRNVLSSPEVRYAIFGREVGESGTPHLQGYLAFLKVKRLNAVIRALPGCHVEKAKGNEQQNFEYCSKDGDYEEFGRRSEQGKRTDLSAAIESLKEGGMKRVIEEHTETFTKYYRGLEALEYRLNNTPYEHPECRGIWVYGPPGTGKSHSVREKYPEAYIKQQNKWWDGYAQEKVIILDDLDTAALGHHLKIWADKYACSGEFKGGTVHLRHQVFIVTSNYTPEQLWPDDQVMAAAIRRRFIITKKEHRNTLIKWRGDSCE